MDPTQPAVPALFFAAPILLLALFFVAFAFVLSRLSGWSRLARRFRANEPFYGESWSWQSASLRWGFHYNNCLTIGANPEAFYLAVTPLLRIFSPFTPPLLIPWSELEVQTGKAFFGWYDTAVFRAGREERVSIRVGGKLVNRLRQAAGPGWPLHSQEQMNVQTR